MEHQNHIYRFQQLLTTGVLLLSEVLPASWEPLCPSLSTLQEPSQRSHYLSRGSRVYDGGHCDDGGHVGYMMDMVDMVDIVDMRDTVDSLDMEPFQLSRWGTRGSGCSRHHCLSRRCCPLIKKMVVVLTMMIICIEQEYLDDNNVDVLSVLSQGVQLGHL